MADKTHYEILGVKPSASAAEIKLAYRKLSSQLHPDRNVHDPKAAEKMARVNEAYTCLGDEARRADYDAGGSGREPDSPESQRRTKLMSTMASMIAVSLTKKFTDMGLLHCLRETMNEAIQQQQAILEQAPKDMLLVHLAVGKLKGPKDSILLECYKAVVAQLDQQIKLARSRITEVRELLQELNGWEDGHVGRIQLIREEDMRQMAGAFRFTYD